MHHDHDALFRQTFGDPRHAGALLREILPAALAQAIDWSTLTLVPGSFVDEDLRSRHADLLFAVDACGSPIRIHVVLEHKSFADRFTALQLLHYVVRIVDRHRREHPGATHVPPVVPVVVHHGKRSWNAPRTALELVALDPFAPAVRKILAPLQPNLHFLLDDLAALPESRLRARRITPQGALTLLALQFVRDAVAGDPLGFAKRWLPLWRAMWTEPAGRLGLLSLFSYLASQLEVPQERFRAAVARIHDENEIMGKTVAQQWLEEGMEKGMAHGRAELLLRLIQRRFGAVDPAIEARVRAAGIDTLDLWGDRILTVASLDELFA